MGGDPEEPGESADESTADAVDDVLDLELHSVALSLALDGRDRLIPRSLVDYLRGGVDLD